MSLLSIVVPTRNRAHLLPSCLDSLLTTTVPVEIVIADNASDDATPELIADYCRRDARIRSWRQPQDVGILQNINDLFADARGDYVCLFTDDDIALPGCFEAKVALLDELPDLALVYSLWERIDTHGNVAGVVKWPGLLDFSYIGGRNEFADLFIASYMTAQALVFRRSLFLEHGGIDLKLKATGDWDMLLRFVRGRRTAFLHTPTCQVRTHADSYTEKNARPIGMNAQDKLDIWRKWLVDHPEPPVFDPVTWNRLAESLVSDLRWHYGTDLVQIDKGLAELSEILRLHAGRVDARAREFAAEIVREAATFKPGALPLSLDGRRETAFLHLADWSGEEWKAVLRAYIQAFQAADDVSLVLWVEPASLERVSQAILAVLAGERQDDLPDLLLVPDALDLQGQARLYASVDCVVPFGDKLSTERARRMGVPTLDRLEKEAWWEILARRVKSLPV